MSNDGVTTLMDGAKQVSILSLDEEFALAEQMQSGDPQAALEARNALIAANIRFVTHLAHGYVKSNETSLEDYISVGLEAMVKNADKFVAGHGKFVTFIKPWVKKAFQEIRYADSAVAVPRHRHIAINKVHRTMERLTVEHGPFADITDEMVAESAGMSVEDVRDCLGIHSDYLRRLPSLDAPLSDEDGATLRDTVSNDYTVDEAEDFSDPMQAALAALTPDEAQVIMMTAGLDGTGDMSNTEIAEAMGIKPTQVRALLTSARKKMADLL